MATAAAPVPLPIIGPPPPLSQIAALTPADALRALHTGPAGLDAAEAGARAVVFGPNAVRSHHVNPWSVLARQLRNPLLWLLFGAATLSAFVGQVLEAVLIGVILTASIGLGFGNELRAARATAALHSAIRRQVTTLREGMAVSVDVTALVPGDIVQLGIGAIVPADLLVLSSHALTCDESILTGESIPAAKSAHPTAPGAPMAEWSGVLFAGTVVQQGRAEAVVVATGATTQFGRIALGLGERHPLTEFEIGLTRFSGLLSRIGAILSVTILGINIAIGRPLIDALLFSLAIAVGITPQLLPAVVTTGLATGARRLARRRVLVKRLVSIEDLGDVDVLLTDKTGTLTEGRISFEHAITPSGEPSTEVLAWGLVCTESPTNGDVMTSGSPLDRALWEAAIRTDPVTSSLGAIHQIDVIPFDHGRRRVTVLGDVDGQRMLISTGAPEHILALCTAVTDEAHRVLDTQFAAGRRVVAVARRAAPDLERIAEADEHDLTLIGYLVFLDQPKASATAAMTRLRAQGITVKIVTGDNPRVAESVWAALGGTPGDTLTGTDLDSLNDSQLVVAVRSTSIFARVSPEHKARIVRAHRQAGSAVAFLGDGVNDALALHHADVGISVDTATDIARDAADVILLAPDLDVLADGVAEGRRLFANTIKYVLMGTSSNFGNMVSVTAAAAFLPFLPMLPFQILLTNLLYDASQMAIPTDRVDEEQLARPSHWDIRYIRAFMVRFGPLSSVFDLATFAVMLHIFNLTEVLFRTGWFIESLATQTLIVFVIRTRQVPFTRSRPSRPLMIAVIAVVTIGMLIPHSPLATPLGFAPLPPEVLIMLAALAAIYLGCVEFAKRSFHRTSSPTRPRTLHRRHSHRVHRMAARWSHHRPLRTHDSAPAPQ